MQNTMIDVDSLPNPPFPPLRYSRHSIEDLPNELLLQVASYLSLDDLLSFISSAPSNYMLKRITIGSKHFAPWRRIWDGFQKAYQAALEEATDTALKKLYGDKGSGGGSAPAATPAPAPSPAPAPAIVSSGQVLTTRKGPKELYFESILQHIFEYYGFRSPDRSSPLPAGQNYASETTFPAIIQDTLFTAIENTLSHQAPATRVHWRLRKLECCDIPLLRQRLEQITNAPLDLVQGCFFRKDFNMMGGDETEQVYKLLTAYLFFTSLKPSQVLETVCSATPVAKREMWREENYLRLMEYFCFLGLWVDVWETQVGMLRYSLGRHVYPTQFTGDHNRRVLSGRLKDYLRIGFAPCKPIVGGESRADVPQPTAPCPRNGALPRRSLSANVTDSIDETRQAGPHKRISWRLERDDALSSMLTPRGHVGQAMSTLTEEQRMVVDTDVGRGELMKVRAYAGTGKTRSLVEYAKRRPEKRFLYVAFNHSAATDARAKFAPNVDCKTVHALALGVLHCVAPRVHAAKGNETMPIPAYWGHKDITGILKLDTVKNIIGALVNPADHFQPGRRPKKTTAESPVIAAGVWTPSSQESKKPFPTATSVATTVKWTLESFWNSTDREVTQNCLPGRMIDKLGLKSNVVLQWAKGIWMAILHGRAPWLPHDAYLKLLHLLGQESGADQLAFGAYDIIMFDEAQDANPCMAAVILRQQSKDKNGLIIVGDPYQRIYGFRGAGNEAFDDEKFPPVKTCYLTWSFRFGDGVAGVANILLRALGERVPVNGARKHDAVYSAFAGELSANEEIPPPSTPFTVIFRKNITLIEYAIAFALSHPNHKLYLRIKRDFQKSTLFNSLRDAYHLYHHNRAFYYPLKVWKSWADLKVHVEAESADGGASDNPILSVVVLLEPRIADGKFLSYLSMVEANVLDEHEKCLADVTLVTAHQAKGLEWDRVQVADDFKPDYSLRARLGRVKYWREEACILYVALTRAREELIISDPLRHWFAAEHGTERLFVRSLKGSKCPYCDGTRRGSDVLVCSERILPVGSFSRSVDTGVNGPQVFMCQRCVHRVLHFYDMAGQGEQRSPEFSVAATHCGSLGEGDALQWLVRKAEEERDAKSETELIRRWVNGVWGDWRDVAEKLPAEED